MFFRTDSYMDVSINSFIFSNQPAQHCSSFAQFYTWTTSSGRGLKQSSCVCSQSHAGRWEDYLSPAGCFTNTQHLTDFSKVTSCFCSVSPLFLSLSRSLLHLCASHHLRHAAQRLLSCLGKDTVELSHPEVSCHLCHLGLAVYCGRLLSTCTSWAEQRHSTWFDQRLGDRTWLMRLYVRESPRVCRERTLLLHKHISCTDTKIITRNIIKEKEIRKLPHREGLKSLAPECTSQSHLVWAHCSLSHTSTKLSYEHLGSRQAY